MTDQSRTKKSKINKIIESLESLRLCNKHFKHDRPQVTEINKPILPIINSPSPYHSKTNSGITFPVPRPFQHPPHSNSIDQSTPSSASFPSAFTSLETNQKPTPVNQLVITHTESPNVTSSQPLRPPSTATGTISISRCCGTTRDGKPCSRKPMKTMQTTPGQKPVNLTQKLDELDQILSSSTPAPSSRLLADSLVPRFCFQHYQKANAQPGAFFGKSIWIEYSDWFASELPDDVKITLKTEMSKPPTEKDRNEHGYLYCHEMRPPGGKQGGGKRGTYIKVGRSTRPVARLGEWSKQCPSRTPIVRGFFPEYSGDTLNPGNTACYLDGIQTVSPRGLPFHRKWERLALIELAGWAVLQRLGSPRSPCPDCSKVHLELFEFDLGSYERLVKPLILKWQKWCQFAYL